MLWCGARWAVSGESKTSQDADGVARSRGAVAEGVEWHSDGEFVVLVANVGPGLLAKGYMERADRAALGLDWLSARHGTVMETMEARCTHGAEDLATLAPILATIPGSNYGGGADQHLCKSRRYCDQGECGLLLRSVSAARYWPPSHNTSLPDNTHLPCRGMQRRRHGRWCDAGSVQPACLGRCDV